LLEEICVRKATGFEQLNYSLVSVPAIQHYKFKPLRGSLIGPISTQYISYENLLKSG